MASPSRQSNGAFKFAQLLNWDHIQGMMSAHYKATGMPSGIIDAHSGQILAGAGWQDICSNFHRVNPESAALCQQSDTRIFGQMSGGKPYGYKCPHGLWDIGTPILVNGRHMATFFLGQFFYEGEQPDREFFVQQAKRYGFETGAYLEALDKVPVFSKEKVSHILEYNASLAAFISELAQGRLETLEEQKRNRDFAARLAESRDASERMVEERTRELSAKERQFALAMEAVSDGLWDFYPASGQGYLSPIWYEMLGYEPNELPPTFETYAKVIHPDDKQRVLRIMQENILQGAPFSVRFRALKKGGGHIWVQSRGKTVEWDQKGNPRRALGTHSDVTAMKSAEMDLARSEKRFRALFDNASVGIALHEMVYTPKAEPLDYIITDVNQSYVDIIGLDADKVLGLKASLAYGTSRPPYLKIYDQVARTGQPTWFETYFEPLDKHFSVVVYSPQPGQFATLFEDITRRKKDAELLRETLNELDAIFNNSQVGLMLLMGGRYLLRGNQRLADILGYDSPEEMAGFSMRRLHLNEERFLEFGRKYYQTLAQGENIQVEYQLRHKDGSPVWCVLSGKALDKNEPRDLDKGVIWVIDDLTRMKEAEESLRASEAKFRTFMEQASESLIIFDLEGRFIEVNREACESLGYRRDELLKMSVAEVDPQWPTEKTRKFVAGLVPGRPALVRGTQVRKNGNSFPVEIAVGVLDVAGEKRFMAVARDITQRKQQEERLEMANRALEQRSLELAEKNQELEQFAYAASHDLQEPLRAIAGFLQLLDKKYHELLDDKGRHYIERSVAAAMRMQKLVNDLLELSRIDTRGKEFAPTDMSEALDAALANLASALRESGVGLVRGKLPAVMADQGQMVSLWQNLVGNAIKYRAGDKPRVEIGVEVEPERYKFFVKDNGIGINPAFHERIFIVFQRLHTRNEHPGTGLGLALCKKIVERHRGEIWVDSQEGRGSTFYFSLPKEAS